VERRGCRFQIHPDDLDPQNFTCKELALATKNFDPKQAIQGLNLLLLDDYFSLVSQYNLLFFLIVQVGAI